MPAYDPTWESLDEHPVPEWYEDAKLGVFVHWYPNAVPGYGFGWYAHDMHRPDPEDQTDDKDVHSYHRDHYGAPTEEMADGDEPVFEYKDFVRETDRALDPDVAENFGAESFDPEEWADLFEAAGAQYVVPVAEHHDGFPMWAASFTDWTAAEMGPERDVIAELCETVRNRGLKFAGSHHRMYCYYDPRYTGLFGHPGFDDLGDHSELDGEAPDEAFVEEWLGTIREMFDHHEPDLLWLDGDWGATAETYRSKELLADYYNAAEEWDKEVVTNDRLGRVRWDNDGETHGDFYTPEYTKFDRIVAHKWESNRSLGDAWTYDRTEDETDLLSVTELVRNFVDIVAKNGNMLINVGPRPDGRIPEPQTERLRGIGRWLEAYGEAVYGTRYWVTAEDETGDVAVRYTADGEFLNAFLFGWPSDDVRLSVPEYVALDRSYTVELLGEGDDGQRLELEWAVEGDELVVETPEEPPAGEVHDHACALRIQVADPGEDAFEAADVPPEEDDVVRSRAELRRRADGNYDESTWEIED
jgi:alpha-L-fucosidase